MVGLCWYHSLRGGAPPPLMVGAFFLFLVVLGIGFVGNISPIYFKI